MFMIITFMILLGLSFIAIVLPIIALFLAAEAALSLIKRD